MNRWSETLRLELVPLGVRTMTLMVGTVESQLNDKASGVTLPTTSSYRPIKEEIEKNLEYPVTPADKFADGVVSDVLSGKSGYVFMATSSWILKWVLPFLPQWGIVSTSDSTPTADFNAYTVGSPHVHYERTQQDASCVV